MQICTLHLLHCTKLLICCCDISWIFLWLSLNVWVSFVRRLTEYINRQNHHFRMSGLMWETASSTDPYRASTTIWLYCIPGNYNRRNYYAEFYCLLVKKSNDLPVQRRWDDWEFCWVSNDHGGIVFIKSEVLKKTNYCPYYVHKINLMCEPAHIKLNF